MSYKRGSNAFSYFCEFFRKFQEVQNVKCMNLVYLGGGEVAVSPNERHLSRWIFIFLSGISTQQTGQGTLVMLLIWVDDDGATSFCTLDTLLDEVGLVKKSVFGLGWFCDLGLVRNQAGVLAGDWTT